MTPIKYFFLRLFYNLFFSKKILKMVISSELDLGELYNTSSGMNMTYLGKGIFLMKTK